MKKTLLTIAVLLISSMSFADATYTIQAGDERYTPIPECGMAARAKAVYSRATNGFALRVCDNTLCRYPVRLNTNARYQDKNDTDVYFSASQGIRLNSTCYEYPLRYKLASNQRHIKAVFGSDTWIQNRARINIELY